MRTVLKGAGGRLLILLLLAAVALPVAGCGRKGAPEPPPGADYPRTYPSR
jgi:predicted small lipoprotein YifL